VDSLKIYQSSERTYKMLLATENFTILDIENENDMEKFCKIQNMKANEKRTKS